MEILMLIVGFSIGYVVANYTKQTDPVITAPVEADNSFKVTGRKLVEIDYKDGNGNISKGRTVAIMTFCSVGQGDYALFGFCFERKQFRVFRTDRITRMVDMGTGELIENIPAYTRALLEEAA